MSRYNRRRGLLRHFVLLLSIPLFVSGSSYALLSQNLSIDASGSEPVYVSTQYMLLTYTKTVTLVSGRWNYSTPMTIRNNGPTSVTAWQIIVDLPADFTNRTCPTSVVCTMSGQTLTIRNGTGNGTIAKNATRSFTISYRTLDRYYTLQNVYVSGTYIAGFQTITGLTVSRVQGARTKVGSVYRWPFTFTVTNNSGFNLSAWQITVPWTTARSVISMPAGVTYVINGSSLLITSTAPLANNTTYVFTATLGSTTTTWNLSATVKGQP